MHPIESGLRVALLAEARHHEAHKANRHARTLIRPKVKRFSALRRISASRRRIVKTDPASCQVAGTAS